MSFLFEKKLLQGGAVLDSGENMHFIVSRVKAIKSKSEESESHGWVKLEFYDNKGEGETDWLPILSETASNGCGFWSLPETGVQALACIFDGTKSGFVIGFLYDEKHKPPVKENEKACDRTILQTKNHRFELVDEEGKETISISTSKGKMRVVLASDGGIEIANKMKKGKIEIEAEELEIESENLILDEYSTSIEAGVLEITNSNSVSLNTKKDFKVKGKNVKLNGSTGVTAKGRQIAKQDDKVIGVDTHILMAPSPSGAVPTPFSHPFVGALKEDLAASVKIWNNKVATKGSVAKHLAGHVPMGPGPFQKTPDNKGKVTGGTEKSVKANGKEVAVIGSSVTPCNDIGARNNSKILAAGMAINMPAIAAPMKSEAYERERKKAEEKEEEKKEESIKTQDINSDLYKVGSYQDIKGVKNLDAHHIGQKAIMKKFIANYDESKAPAINVPKLGHTKRHPTRGIISRSSKGITNARQLLARDIAELKRVYPDVPKSAIKKLIDMNKKMYPEMRKK